MDPYAQSNSSVLLFDLVAKENTINKIVAQHVRNQDFPKAQEVSDDSPSPFNQINELLEFGRLTVRLENLDDRHLVARHLHESSFSIAEMSDGERNAMLIAADVITAKLGAVFLIDEPERHLHRSIIQPFLSALFALRRADCTFIISTHEIALPVANPDARVLILRSCQWSGNQCTAWDAEVLEPNSQLPEELKRAILGSRKRMLFVEGESSGSLDLPLYAALFPGLSVEPMGSCEEVQKAVLGLKESQDHHDVEAFGLIDRDDRPSEDVRELSEKGVFALEAYSVEALYYCSDAIAAIAHRQAESLGDDPNELIKSAKQEAFKVLENHAERMAARMCERQIRKLTLSKVPDWQSIMDNPTQSISIPIDPQLYSEELDRFNKFVNEGDIDRLVARYPLHKSCAFTTIATTLRCRDKSDYERMVLVQIQRDDELAEKLKKRIGLLSSRLDQVEGLETA